MPTVQEQLQCRASRSREQPLMITAGPGGRARDVHPSQFRTVPPTADPAPVPLFACDLPREQDPKEQALRSHPGLRTGAASMETVTVPIRIPIHF